MKRFILLLSSTILVGCALNPVMEPYSVQPMGANQNGGATIWGEYGLSGVMFRELDGKSLPSRKGGGYPISLFLSPGKHVVEVHSWRLDRGDINTKIEIVVEAGHTYTINSAGLQLVDLGTDVACHFERPSELYGGQTNLLCAPKKPV